MDAFSVLDLPRAPWVDAEVLKERFHRLGATRHPDAPGGSEAAFSELNTAWQTLREPASCLRHFLQLTAPESLAGATATPAELGDLFMEIAGRKQAAQHFLTAREKATTPLARALIEPQKLALGSQLDSTEVKLNKVIAEVSAGVREENAQPDVLAAALSRLTFLANWRHQFAELKVRLG